VTDAEVSRAKPHRARSGTRAGSLPAVGDADPAASSAARGAGGVAPSVSGLEVALDRVGDRWCLLVVEALLNGPGRFNDIAEALPRIAPNILSDRLRRLVRARILLARPYSERPARYAYELTAEGRELAGVLRLLANWGSSSGLAEPPRHLDCGTPLEARWYCPTCGRSVEDADSTELRRL
jgi:DNA-binding HxlR family transcriptional regulator